MTRNEFLEDLRNMLSSIPEAEREDILKDYKEHFSAGQQEGYTETEICEKLGDPAGLAAQYLEGSEHSGNAESKEDTKTDNKNENSDEQSQQYNSYTYANPYNNNNSYGTTRAGMSKDTAALVIVLVSIFVAFPIASTIFGIYIGLCGAVVGLVVGGVAVVVSGILISEALLTVGLILLGISLLLFSFALITGITAITKQIIKLINWYISGCKNLNEKGVFNS